MKLSIEFDIWGFSYRMMRTFIRDKWLKYFRDLRYSILKSRMKVSLEAYVCFLLFSTSIAFGVTLAVSYFYIYYMLKYNILYTILVSLAIAVISGASYFSITYSYPALKAGSLARNIDDELPYVIAHMNVLASAGASPERIIRSIASISNSPTGMFMKDIVRDIDLLGMDIVSTLNNAKERAPSKTLESFVAEMVSVISTGGNIQEFLSSYGRELLGTKAIEAKEFSETLATLAEVFIIMMVVFPLLMIIMLSIMSLVGGNLLGLPLSTLMWFVTYIMVPLLGISFIIMLDQVMPRGE